MEKAEYRSTGILGFAPEFSDLRWIFLLKTHNKSVEKRGSKMNSIDA